MTAPLPAASPGIPANPAMPMTIRCECTGGVKNPNCPQALAITARYGPGINAAFIQHGIGVDAAADAVRRHELAAARYHEAMATDGPTFADVVRRAALAADDAAPVKAINLMDAVVESCRQAERDRLAADDAELFSPENVREMDANMAAAERFGSRRRIMDARHEAQFFSGRKAAGR